MRGVSREIRQSLVHDTVPKRRLPRPVKSSMADVLLKQLAGEVLRQLEDEASGDDTGHLENRLTSLEALVHQLVAADVDEEDEEEQEDEDSQSRFPNLKYAKPKYKDVDSVLKYIEDGDSGALKLVIMNFND